MPLSLLEAMSYGNCCLVSDIPENTEVVEECGVTFKKSNVFDLKKQIEYLIDYPQIVHGLKDKSADFICKKLMEDSTHV